jgi:hypothetical protein
VKFPVVALEAAPNNTAVLAPAATLNGLDGLDCKAVGRPLRVTCTVPANPFWPATDTFTGELVPPCSTESEAVESVIVISSASQQKPRHTAEVAEDAEKKKKAEIGDARRNCRARVGASCCAGPKETPHASSREAGPRHYGTKRTYQYNK